MPEGEKLAKGQARVQFVTNSGRIDELFAEGYDISNIYKKLRQEKRISMSYGSFHDNFTRLHAAFPIRRRGRRERALAKQAPTSASQRQTTMSAGQISGRAAPPPLNLGSQIHSKSSKELLDEFRLLNESCEQERAKRRGTTGPNLERSALADIDKSFGGND